MDKIIIVDGSYLLYRNVFAPTKDPAYSAWGKDVTAWWLMHQKLRRYEAADPYGLVVCLDAGGDWRRKKYPYYKANRPPSPPEIKAARELFPHYLEAAGVCHIGVEGYEADDVIYTLANSGKKYADEVWIISPDKDFWHILDDKIKIVLPRIRDKPTRAWTREKLKAEHGYDPKRYLLKQAIMGDTSDNVPGIKGIGDKKAEKLVKCVKSLHELEECLMLGADRVLKDVDPDVIEDFEKVLDKDRARLLDGYYGALESMELVSQVDVPDVKDFWINYPLGERVKVNQFHIAIEEACSKICTDFTGEGH